MGHGGLSTCTERVSTCFFVVMELLTEFVNLLTSGSPLNEPPSDHPITLVCQTDRNNDTGDGRATVVQVKSPEPWGSHHT